MSEWRRASVSSSFSDFSGKTKKRRPMPWTSHPSGIGRRRIFGRPVSRSRSPPAPSVADMKMRCFAPVNGAWDQVGGINGRIMISVADM